MDNDEKLRNDKTGKLISKLLNEKAEKETLSREKADKIFQNILAQLKTKEEK